MTDKFIDLHTHSIFSDGSMTPKELVQKAYFAGLSAISLTDHDTVSGVKEAVEAGREYGVEVVPGIELSALSDTETHILGYFIDIDNPDLEKLLENIVKVRRDRISETCEILSKNNISISLHEVEEISGGSILCRAHIARVMTDKGYSGSPKEAFATWLGVGCPAYSEMQSITDEEAIEIINSCGGDAYLAHLNQTKKSGDELDRFVKRLSEAGLKGIEGYYTEYTEKNIAEYRSLALKYGLSLSGGTDFHGSFKPHIEIGTGYGDLKIPYSVYELMKDGRK